MYTNFLIKIEKLFPNYQKLLNEEMNNFYPRLKLKAHFRDDSKVAHKEGKPFRPVTSSLRLRSLKVIFSWGESIYPTPSYFRKN